MMPTKEYLQLIDHLNKYKKVIDNSTGKTLEVLEIIQKGDNVAEVKCSNEKTYKISDMYISNVENKIYVSKFASEFEETKEEYTFFVLDFSETYPDDSIKPVAYLVPVDKLELVKRYAVDARNSFHEDNDPQCIGDYFINLLTDNDIHFEEIGDMNIISIEKLHKDICVVSV